jgi:hypothetical protein
MSAGTSTDLRPALSERLGGRLSRGEWLTVVAMTAAIVALHVIGWGLLIFVISPRHYAVGSKDVFGIGLGLTAYTLGMRHAFDADHIAAIDNTTRKLMAERKRPVSIGFWFSLGHSSVVFGLCLLLALGVRALAGQVENGSSSLQNVTSLIGTTVSGVFLYLIGIINLVVLVGIIKVFRQMRAGSFDDQVLEEQLNKRGLMNRILGGVTKAVRPRVRHRHRGRPAGAGRRRGCVRVALVRDLDVAGPVRGGDEPARLDRRLLHELRLRVGLLQARPKGLLQHYDHRAVGRRRPDHRHDRTTLGRHRPAEHRHRAARRPR